MKTLLRIWRSGIGGAIGLCPLFSIAVPSSAYAAPKDSVTASVWNPATKKWDTFAANATVWISTDPKMPSLAAQDVITGATKLPKQVFWQFHSKYVGASTRSIDSRDLPLAAELYTKPWYPDYGSELFGGDARFDFYDTGNSTIRTFSFKIRGQNPSISQVTQYISGSAGALNFASAIFRHESYSPQYKTYYNQFVPGGSSLGEPFKGAGDAWGIAQLDYSGESKTASTKEAWNWQANVDSGIKVLKGKQATALDYFAAIKNDYPKQWEEPPAYLVPKTKTTLSALDAATIGLYRKWTVPFKDKAGVYHYSCWKFDPNGASKKRWTFVPDEKNYLYLVISENGG